MVSERTLEKMWEGSISEGTAYANPEEKQTKSVEEQEQGQWLGRKGVIQKGFDYTRPCSSEERVYILV